MWQGFFHSLIAYFAFGFYTFVNFTAILRDGLENRLTYFGVMQREIPELLFFNVYTLHLLPNIIACVLLLKATFRGFPLACSLAVRAWWFNFNYGFEESFLLLPQIRDANVNKVIRITTLCKEMNKWLQASLVPTFA